MKGVAECLKLTNLFYFISLRASLEPGSTLGEKGEKNRMGKKKRISKQSQLRGSLGRGKGGVHRLAHFDRLYFSYLTPFFPFFPQCGVGSQANLIIKYCFQWQTCKPRAKHSQKNTCNTVILNKAVNFR